jgi:hypothetical protein
MNLRYQAWLLRNRIGRLRVLMAAKRHGVCAEVGVWKGDFSHRILQFCRPRELHLVDPWHFAPQFPDRWYGGAVAQSQQEMDAIMASVVQRFSESQAVQVHRGKSCDVALAFQDGYFDWVYIDGDHSYKAVLSDLEAWYPKVRPGGYLALDDLDWTDESSQRSVEAAIATFLASRNTRMAKPMQGQFMIQKA